jgi:hypothetical protein
LRIAALVLAILSVLAVVGCDREAGRNRARLLAEGFLSGISGGQPDYGWSFLHPESQRFAFDGDYETYRSLVEDADWTAFEWEVIDVLADDSSLHFLTLSLPGGEESVPAFLRDHHGWSIIALDRDPTRAVIRVRLGVPLGPSGVWAAGG